jgi:hypothetical protein
MCENLKADNIMKEEEECSKRWKDHVDKNG